MASMQVFGQFSQRLGTSVKAAVRISRISSSCGMDSRITSLPASIQFPYLRRIQSPTLHARGK